MNQPASRIESIIENRVRVLRDLTEFREVRDEEPREDENLAPFTSAQLPAVWIWEEDETVETVDTERSLCTTPVIVGCVFTHESNGPMRLRARGRHLKALIQRALAQDLGCGTDPDTGEANAWGFFERSNAIAPLPKSGYGWLRIDYELTYYRDRRSPYRLGPEQMAA